MKMRLGHLFLGKPTTFKKGIQSAYVKEEVSQIKVYKDYAEGNDVSNEKHHGGLDRILHHFPADHFDFLQNKFPHIAHKFIPGCMAENISTVGITDDFVCLGDVMTIGDVKLQVTEPRNPCGTIDLFFEEQGVMETMLLSLKVGWFYRVLEEGVISSGDEIKVVERPHPEINLSLIFKEFKIKRGRDNTFVEKVIGLPELSLRYREYGKKLLKNTSH